jgi:hypothetical protein
MSFIRPVWFHQKSTSASWDTETPCERINPEGAELLYRGLAVTDYRAALRPKGDSVDTTKDSEMAAMR